MNSSFESVLPLSQLTWSQSFCILFSTIQLGIFFSCLFVSYIYERNSDDCDSGYESEDTTIYIDKYPIADAIQSNDEQVNANSYIFELTPRGFVVMKYDYDEEGFVYWANKAVPYSHLETVARKYVKNFSCKDLYIDRARILKEKCEAIKEHRREEKECRLMLQEDTLLQTQASKVTEEESVFANFKSYNTETKDDNAQTSNVVVADKSNKYIHKGNVVDFEILKRPESALIHTSTKEIDFSTFKNMFLEEGVENHVIEKSDEQKKDD